MLGGDKSVHEVEAENLGIDHQEAGAIIGEKLRISPLVQVVLRYHHGGEGPAEYQRVLSIVRLADVCAHKLGAGYREGLELGTEPAEADLEAKRFDRLERMI